MSNFAEFWKCSREEYDAAEEWKRSSELKDFWQCPFIYYSRHVAGTMPRKSLGDEAFMGTCVHAMALEGKQDWKVAGTCGATLESGKRKGEPCGVNASEWYDVDNDIWVCGKHKAGRNVIRVTDALTPEQHERVLGMCAAIERYPEVKQLLSGQNHEKAARSVDPETGVKKKALIDVILKSPFTIVDLKTTGEFNAESIWRKFDSHGWGLSLAHYESVLQDIAAAAGRSLVPARWQFIVVESVAPFRCQLWPAGGVEIEVQEEMRREHRELLREFAACEESGEWRERQLEPGVPQWFFYRHGMQRETSL